MKATKLNLKKNTRKLNYIKLTRNAMLSCLDLCKHTLTDVFDLYSVVDHGKQKQTSCKSLNRRCIYVKPMD